MLDLDIVLNYFRGISPISVNTLPSEHIHAGLCDFYTRNLDTPGGSAGYRITDEFLFCGRLVQAQTGITVLIGPAVEQRLSPDAVGRICRETGRNQRKLQNALVNLPQVSLTVFMQSVFFLNYVLNENNTLLPFRTSPRPAHAVKADPGAVFHNTAEFENAIISSIEFGRPDLVRRLWNDPAMQRHTMGRVSADTLRALKSTLVTAATLACRAAVREGLSYNYAMTLSDSYLQRAETVSSYDVFSALLQEMLLDLASRTAELQLGEGASRLARDTARRINANLYNKITVEQLAREMNISSSYLSRRFKQETGIRLSDYIAMQKVNEAKRLMRGTNLSLAQIAYQLSFSSQSYFHAVFKKVTGVTPGKHIPEEIAFDSSP